MKCLRRYFPLLILVTLIGALLWQLFTPDTIEDLAMRFVDAPCGPPTVAIDSPSMLVTALCRFVEYDNSRLANLLYITLTTLPDPLTDVLCAVGVAALLFLIIKLSARGESPTAPFVAAASMMFLALLPWYDHMEVSDYQLNYVVSSAVGFAALLAWRHEKYALSVAVTFLAAWMHEALAVALAAYFLIGLIENRSRLNVSVFIASLLGFAVNISPAVINRVNTVGTGAEPLNIISIFTSAVAVAIFLVVFIVNIRCRRVAMFRMTAILAAVIATSACALVGRVYDRAFWFADAFSILGILTYLAEIKSTGLTRTISSVWLAVYALFWSQVCVWEYRVGTEHSEVNDRVASGETIVFKDMTADDQVPWWTLDFVQARNSVYAENHWQAIMSPAHSDFYAVLPSRFADRDFDDWDKIPGDNPFRGEIPYLFSRHDLHIDCAIVTLGDATIAKPLNQRLRLLLAGHDTTTVGLCHAPLVTASGDTLHLYFLRESPATIFHDRPITSVTVLQTR